ncbi:hypothetical protein Cylst_1267 [Cylindrospermum stagnale PCC 7417]|uniref:Uncharacterized protein n=1 Tax=Cylindrospermum stagnale PCC 7417 TaxID=56107 RepID=K9WT83_9NOST|nr:hypothetical protein [Cylindrospermum stagnale]AFZ23560.1 hypothetical protein Cylst_1267 [Cylindrospermum stagnale PCC 7417]
MNIFQQFNLYQKKAPVGKTEMIWTLILSGFLINIVGVLAMPQTAQAHLPPLSTEELEEKACCIVVGKVKSVSNPEPNPEWGPYKEVTVIVEVISIEKGLEPIQLADPNDNLTEPSKNPKPGDKITIYYRQQGGGKGGSIGQDHDIPLNAKVRLFLIIDYKDRFQLLDPNGWQAVSSDWWRFRVIKR